MANLKLVKPRHTLVYAMRWLEEIPMDEWSHKDISLDLPDDNQAKITLHMISGTKEEIRKAAIVLLGLAALWTAVDCSMSTVYHKWLFSYGEVGVEIGDGALIVSHGGMFIMDYRLLWAYPRLVRGTGSHWVLTVPLWIPFILFSSYPTVALISLKKNVLKNN